MERFDRYYDKSGNYPAPVKRVIAIPMPDPQTQIAQFMTGGVDLLRNVPADAARELAQGAERRRSPPPMPACCSISRSTRSAGPATSR